jgi:NTE family protein
VTAVLQGTYWGIGSAPESYGPGAPPGYSKLLAQEVLARVRTDMDAFSEAEVAVLENHGYLLAEAAVRRHVPGLLPPDPAPLTVPHPQWMDEGRVRTALQGSDQRRLLGRF